MTARRPIDQVLRNAQRSMTNHGWVAFALVVLCAVVLIKGGADFVRSALVKPVDLSGVIASQEERIAKFDEAFARYLKQIEGRAQFHPPPPPPEPEEPRDEEPVVADGPPPPPTRYGGPGIIAMLGKRVWFDDGRVMSVGDEADGGLEVVEPRGPWSAVLRWRGIEFEVPLFERTTEQFIVQPDTRLTDDKG